MYKLFYENECLITKDNEDDFIDVLDYLFISRRCVGDIQVEINNIMYNITIEEFKDYFKIRNKLIEEKIKRIWFLFFWFYDTIILGDR